MRQFVSSSLEHFLRWCWWHNLFASLVRGMSGLGSESMGGILNNIRLFRWPIVTWFLHNVLRMSSVCIGSRFSSQSDVGIICACCRFSVFLGSKWIMWTWHSQNHERRSGKLSMGNAFNCWSWSCGLLCKIRFSHSITVIQLVDTVDRVSRVYCFSVAMNDISIWLIQRVWHFCLHPFEDARCIVCHVMLFDNSWGLQVCGSLRVFASPPCELVSVSVAFSDCQPLFMFSFHLLFWFCYCIYIYICVRSQVSRTPPQWYGPNPGRSPWRQNRWNSLGFSTIARLDTQPSPLDSQLSTLNPRPSTFSPRPSTLK